MTSKPSTTRKRRRRSTTASLKRQWHGSEEGCSKSSLFSSVTMVSLQPLRWAIISYLPTNLDHLLKGYHTQLPQYVRGSALWDLLGDRQIGRKKHTYIWHIPASDHANGRTKTGANFKRFPGGDRLFEYEKLRAPNWTNEQDLAEKTCSNWLPEIIPRILRRSGYPFKCMTWVLTSSLFVPTHAQAISAPNNAVNPDWRQRALSALTDILVMFASLLIPSSCWPLPVIRQIISIKRHKKTELPLVCFSWQ